MFCDTPTFLVVLRSSRAAWWPSSGISARCLTGSVGDGRPPSAMFRPGSGLEMVMASHRDGRTRREQRGVALLTVDDVAERLGVNVRHVRRLVQERRLPFVKWGRLLRFDPVDVAAFVEEHRSAGTPST